MASAKEGEAGGGAPSWKKPALIGGGLTLATVALAVGVSLGVQKNGEVKVDPSPGVDASLRSTGIYCGSSGWDYGVNDSTAHLAPYQILASRDTQFPPGFMWGTATSSYQVEGAVKAGGRGASIWDTFTHAGKAERKETGDVACDHYHRYKEDVQLIKSLGINYYRFSIAWPRILPEGEGNVSSEGVAFYSDLVDELIANDIEPVATMYHWDLPQALQDKYGGWLSSNTSDAFAVYAETLFIHLGDRVKRWLTFNEPWCTAVLGYGQGVHAPGIKDLKEKPYIAAHNQLLAHAKAVKIFREKYQKEQGGLIGITLNTDYKQAACNTTIDRSAAERDQLFSFGWFADPVFFGDYPEVMRSTLGDRLPAFTEQQKADLKQSVDFLGLNHYTTVLVAQPLVSFKGNFFVDSATKEAADPRWPAGESSWLHYTPWGMRRILVWIKERYDNPIILVTENGASEPGEGEKEPDGAGLDDRFRQRYLQGFISEMWKAVHFDKVDVRGYFAWSLMDNFEWADGYRPRFGIVRVEFNESSPDYLKRVPKDSARMYAGIAHRYSTPLENAGGEPAKGSADALGPLNVKRKNATAAAASDATAPTSDSTTAAAAADNNTVAAVDSDTTTTTTPADNHTTAASTTATTTSSDTTTPPTAPPSSSSSPSAHAQLDEHMLRLLRVEEEEEGAEGSGREGMQGHSLLPVVGHRQSVPVHAHGEAMMEAYEVDASGHFRRA